jgi:hypothetical protein
LLKIDVGRCAHAKGKLQEQGTNTKEERKGEVMKRFVRNNGQERLILRLNTGMQIMNSKTISVNAKSQSRRLMLLAVRLSIGLLPGLAAGCTSTAVTPMENNMPLDDLNAGHIPITISAEYNLSYLNFSTRSKEAQSILTWRDMYFHGGRINGEIGLDADTFNRVFIGAEFGKSFNGNWIDDDSNNAHSYFGVTDSSVTVIGFNFALGNESGYMAKRIGLNISSLSFQNYNYRHFTQSNGPFYSDISGKISTYDQAMIRLYADVKNRLVDTSIFYADLSGRAGLALGIGQGNWLLRGDLKHPESFRTTGLFFRAGGSAELGFKIKMFTVYLGIDADYEVSPWLSSLEMFYANGQTHQQGMFQELSHASVNAGVRVRF